jgi:hypothetical protein
MKKKKIMILASCLTTPSTEKRDLYPFVQRWPQFLPAHISIGRPASMLHGVFVHHGDSLQPLTNLPWVASPIYLP